MGRLRDKRRAQWPKDFLKSMALTIVIPSHRWLTLILFELFFLLLLISNGSSSRWMLLMLFYMTIFMRMSIQSNLLGLLLMGSWFASYTKLYISLKQGPCAWFYKFSEVMESASFQQSKAYHSIFIRQSNSATVILIVCQ